MLSAKRDKYLVFPPPSPSMQLSTSEGICLLKSSEYYVCSGDVTGSVHMLDPHTLHVAHSYPAHSAGMCDMDVVGHYLVTCGLVQQ